MLLLEKLEKIVKRRKIVGRGRSRGVKCGRGKEGQLSRSGGRAEIKPSFEGGQMSLCRRIPRRGFKNRNKVLFELVNLATVAQKFTAESTIDRVSLIEKGLIKGRSRHLIKVLGTCDGLEKMNFVVDALSRSAFAAIEKVGGTVQVINKG